ncbi:MAG TPA: AI-2E family transporter [Verrucomicrobia bacterium]|nr:AI-2E family transporter [Verrucomicrobiales bacterium]HIL55742.1 AI-2E family transporter [Verrucomicrobiota bacterium]
METADKKESTNSPSSFQKRTLWKAITGLSMSVIAILLVSAISILGKILSVLQPVLVPLAIAAILSYLLAPIVNWTRRRLLKNIKNSRTWAILIVFTITSIIGLLVALSIIIPASHELGQLFDKKAEIIENAQKQLTKFNSGLASLEDIFGARNNNPSSTEETKTEESQLWNKFIDWTNSPETTSSLINFVGKAANGFIGVLGYLIGLFLIPVYLFFFLRDSAFIERYWDKYIPLKDSSFKDEIVSVVKEINVYLAAYFRGQVVVSFIDGALTGVILMILGLDYALIIGVSLAILGVIPFVGFILTAIPALLIAVAQQDGPSALVVLAVFIVVQQFDGLIIQPKIVGESVGLHALTIIFSVLCWSLVIGGILGALLAVPITASIKVLFQRYIWEQNIQSKIPIEEPIQTT